ncbi:MAG: tRNA lysidine(34) synthetase TilS [Firmicutes bacterium]|nr:tRNA lysidine(34) synthetase TilS [Bacillota bacterium]
MNLVMNENLIQTNDFLVVAISGGIDSMVLLQVLNEMKQRKQLKLFVCHINHHKRNSSNKEEAFVKEVCKVFEIPFKSFSINKATKSNFHDDARNQRYEFFYSYAKEVNATKIVLAHHADDQAETILMRLVRGSSFVGYKGIPEWIPYKDVLIIRPLLTTSKESIEAYQKDMKVLYMEDESNLENNYTRNRFRHLILPQLKNENPKMLEKFNQFSEYISDAYEFIQKASNQFIFSCITKDKDRFLVNQNDFLSLDKIIQKDVAKKLIDLVSNNQVELSYQNIQDIVNVFYNQKPHLELKLDSALIILKSYDEISFQKSKPVYLDFEFTLNHFGKVILPSGDTIVISENSCNCDGKSIELWYNNLDLIFPITVRNRKPGDKITFPFGSKKLKDFLIDQKIPKRIRDSFPIVLSKEGDILWIPDIYQIPIQKGNYKLFLSFQKGI